MKAQVKLTRRFDSEILRETQTNWWIPGHRFDSPDFSTFLLLFLGCIIYYIMQYGYLIYSYLLPKSIQSILVFQELQRGVKHGGWGALVTSTHWMGLNTTPSCDSW